MRILVLIALATTALALAGAPASAQIGNASLPLDIEADHVEVLDAEHRIVWRGNVNAVRVEPELNRVVREFRGMKNGRGHRGRRGRHYDGNTGEARNVNGQGSY